MASRGFLARVYAFRFLDSFVLIYPLYTVMFMEGGMTPSQVAAALMAWSITSFVLQIPSGVVADNWSRRGLLCTAQLVRVAGFALWLFEPSFASFMLGMMLWGAKSAFTNGTFEALVYDELHAQGLAEDYARVLGRAQATGFVAVLATSLGAAVMAPFGYPLILAGSIAAGVAAAVSAMLLPKARKTLQVARRRYLAHLGHGFAAVARAPIVMAIIAFAALSQAFGGGLEGFWPIFGGQAGLARSQIAVFVAAISIAQAAGVATAHRVARAPVAAFHGLYGLVGALLAFAAFTLQTWSVAVVVAIAGLIKVIDVNFDARLHHAIPTESRATIASVKSFAGAVVMTAVLGGFGALAQAETYRAAFLATGLAMVGIAAAYLIAGRLAPRT
jgi:MFS family permease